MDEHPHHAQIMTIQPSADRFRVGDVWRSPRMKDWQCDKVENGLARLRSLRNPKNTQWRGVFDTGSDMFSAWQRITTSTQP
jgi:hypothetical protein